LVEKSGEIYAGIAGTQALIMSLRALRTRTARQPPALRPPRPSARPSRHCPRSLAEASSSGELSEEAASELERELQSILSENEALRAAASQRNLSAAPASPAPAARRRAGERKPGTLMKALEQAAPIEQAETKFSIVFVTSEVHPWSKTGASLLSLLLLN